MIPVIIGHTPAGASSNNVVHYGQGIRSGKFRQYDHGIVKNLLRYRNHRPPTYELGNVRAKVALHYSLNDWLVEPVDIYKLRDNLPNVIAEVEVSDRHFNHFDFVWAIDVKKLLYNKMVAIMKSVE